LKRLILIEGSKGSGKTTLGTMLARAYQSGNAWERPAVTHWEPDFFFYDAMGMMDKDKSKLSQAMTQCKVTIKGAMKRGDEVVILSHTWRSNWERQYYLKLAAEYGYDVQEMFLRGKFKGDFLTDQLVEKANEQLALAA